MLQVSRAFVRQRQRKQNWTDAEFASKLVSSLQGKAMDVYAALSPEKRKSGKAILAAVNQKHSVKLTPAAARVKLQARSQEKYESLAAFAQEVARITQIVHPGAPDTTRSEIEVTAFVNGIKHPEVKLHMDFEEHADLQQAVTRAEALHQAFIMNRGQTVKLINAVYEEEDLLMLNQISSKAQGNDGNQGKSWGNNNISRRWKNNGRTDAGRRNWNSQNDNVENRSLQQQQKPKRQYQIWEQPRTHSRPQYTTTMVPITRSTSCQL